MLDRLNPRAIGSAGRSPPSPRARWQRAYRRRLKAGLIVVPAEIDCEILDLLIRTGWLAESGAGDKAAIGRAVSEILRDASTCRAFDRR
jgi:hypothetical protein